MGFVMCLVAIIQFDVAFFVFVSSNMSNTITALNLLVLVFSMYLRTSDTLIGYLPIFQMLPKTFLCIRYH